MDESKVTELKRRTPRWVLDGADAATRAFALATASRRPFPDFLIVGTKRGGTTSLFNYLVRHPGVLGMFPQIRGKKSTDFYFADRQHQDAWYRSHFHTDAHRRLLERQIGYRPLSFEASPYYMWDPRIAAAVAARAPATKAIVLLRDPVKRAWSHYQERVQNDVEPLPFREALLAEDRRLSGELERMLEDPTYHSSAWDWYSYRSRGEYVDQLDMWAEHFPAEQILVIFSEELYSNTQATMDLVCDFLMIPTFEMPTTRAFNATWRTKEGIPESDAVALRAHYQSYNQRLSERIDRQLPWR